MLKIDPIKAALDEAEHLCAHIEGLLIALDNQKEDDESDQREIMPHLIEATRRKIQLAKDEIEK